MRKAVTTGFFTGIIISGILIGATYLRRFLPDTITANILFFILFFGSIVTVLWLSLHQYCKTSAVKWMSLSLTGIISSIFAALIVSVYGVVYGNLAGQDYIEEIISFSKQKWVHTNDTAESLISDFSGLNMHLNIGMDNFRDLAVVLFILSLIIAAVYYLRNRKRLPDHPSSRNHELIF